MKKITNTTIQVFFARMMLACSNLYAQHSNQSISYSSDNACKSGIFLLSMTGLRSE